MQLRAAALLVMMGCASAPPPAPAPPPPPPTVDPACENLRLQADMLLGQRFLDALSTAPPDTVLEARARELDANFALLCRR